MNREQLAELLADAIIDSGTLDGFSMNWHEKAAAELVDKLWPVLARVWEEGANAQLDEVIFNPYRPHLPDPPPYPSGSQEAGR